MILAALLILIYTKSSWLLKRHVGHCSNYSGDGDELHEGYYNFTVHLKKNKTNNIISHVKYLEYRLSV